MCDLLRQMHDWETSLMARNLSRETQESYKQKALKFFAATLLEPKDVTREIAERYIGSIQSRGAGKASTRAALQSFFDYLEDRGMVDRSPVVKIKIKTPKPPPKSLSRERLDRFLEAAETLNRGQRKRLVFELIYYTGARVGSICAVRPEDIDLEERGIYFDKAKGDKAYATGLTKRAVEVCRELLATMDDQCEKSGTVVGRGVASVEIWCREAGKVAGVKCTPHQLRHSFATHLRQKGATLDAIQPLMNHASMETTRKYARISREQVDSTLELLDESAV